MLFKLLLSLVAFFTRPFHGPTLDDVPDIPYEASPYGPQSWREAHIAMQALQGDNDDMRFHEDWPESAGIKNEYFRWPGAKVPFVIDSSLSGITDKINESFQQYHQKTCIRFVPRTNEQNYILIFKGKGCYSFVGLQSRDPQPVSIGSGCEYVGTIVHELGHAIGLFHEHQRSDRDTYLNVYERNVTFGQECNFKKTASDLEAELGKYDYTSIMHYGNFAFSKRPGSLKTMEAKDGTKLKEPYEKEGLNDSDVELIKKLYKC